MCLATPELETRSEMFNMPCEQNYWNNYIFLKLCCPNRIQAAWEQVWGFHSQWCFMEPCQRCSSTVYFFFFSCPKSRSHMPGNLCSLHGSPDKPYENDHFNFQQDLVLANTAIRSALMTRMDDVSLSCYSKMDLS